MGLWKSVCGRAHLPTSDNADGTVDGAATVGGRAAQVADRVERPGDGGAPGVARVERAAGEGGELLRLTKTSRVRVSAFLAFNRGASPFLPFARFPLLFHPSPRRCHSFG